MRRSLSRAFAPGYDPRAVASLTDLLSLDVRAGTITQARVLRGARRPALALSVDFGALGTRTSHVEVARLYEPEDLVGLQVVAIVNAPPREVAGFTSEVLVLAVDDGRGDNVLVIPERPVPDGGRLRPGEP